MMDRSRQAVPWETTAARPRGGKVRSGTGGGVAYLFADERAGDDDGDVHARALREERRRGTGRSRSDLICLRACGCILSLEPRGSVEARLRIPALATGTHRHRGLVERFEHVVRGFFSEEAFARFGLCPHAQQGGRPKPDRTLPIFAGPEKISWTMISSVCCLHRVMYEHLVWISVEHRVQIRQFSTRFFDSRATLVVPRRAPARSPEEGAHVPLLTARTTANMASKISKMMDRPKTSIFDHGKVRLAKRRVVTTTDGTSPRLTHFARPAPRAERRAPRGSPRGSPLARGLTFRTSDLPSQRTTSRRPHPPSSRCDATPDKTRRRRAGSVGLLLGHDPGEFPFVAPFRPPFSSSSSRVPAKGVQPARLQAHRALEPVRD